MKSSPHNNTRRREEETMMFIILIVIVLGFFLFGPLKGIFIKENEIKEEIPTTPQSNDQIIEKSKLEPNYEIGSSLHFLQYAQGRGWKGEILSVRQDTVILKITEVITKSDKTYHLFPQICSGHKKLSGDSVGTVIRVPKSCFEE